MRPETSLWRKDGRRIARRDSEPVLDEHRERIVRKPSEVTKVTGKVPDHAYVIADTWGADGTPEGWKTITVTPLGDGVCFWDAAAGQDVAEDASMAEQAAIVADLMTDADERLPDLLRKKARTLLALADALEVKSGMAMPAGPDYSYEPAGMDCGA